jgi:uncharacterized membrane protein
MIELQTFSRDAGQILDAAGVLIIIGGAAVSTLAVLVKLFMTRSIHHLYRFYRQNLARSILIGLEFLVAGDIIRSVGGDLSFDSVLILAMIVLIRSFLGMEFEMEIEGHWPWQRTKNTKKA